MDSLRKVRAKVVSKFNKPTDPYRAPQAQESGLGESLGDDHTDRSEAHTTADGELERGRTEVDGQDALASVRSILSSTRRVRNSDLNYKRLSFFFQNRSGFPSTADRLPDHSESNRTGETDAEASERELWGAAEQVVRTDVNRPLGSDRSEQSVANRNSDEMASGRYRLPQITLELPSDPRAVDQKLQIFEALAAKAGLADEDRLIILNSAIESSAFKERMAEVIEVADLASYDRLKRALTEAIKLDLDERYSMVFRAGRRDPLATYNQLRALCPTHSDSQLLPLLKPHLPQYLYVQLQNASFTEQSLKQRLVEHARTASRGIQSYEDERELYENAEMKKLREGQELVSRQLQELKDALKPKAQTVNSVEQIAQTNPGQLNAADPFGGLVSTINRLINQVSSQPNTGRSSRSNRQNNSDSECYSHRRFGNGAYKCKTFCPRFDRGVFCIPAGPNTFMRADAPGATNYQPPPTFSSPPPPYITPAPVTAQQAIQPAAQPQHPQPQAQQAGSLSFQQLIDFTNAIRQLAGTNQTTLND